MHEQEPPPKPGKEPIQEKPFDQEECIKRHGTGEASSLLGAAREAIRNFFSFNISAAALLLLIQFLAVMLVDHPQFRDIRPSVAVWASGQFAIGQPDGCPHSFAQITGAGPTAARTSAITRE